MTAALVIGFGPFPGASRNPSGALVRALAGRRQPALANIRIKTVILPTSYTSALEELPALLKQHDPDIVLFFGLASRTPYLRIEQRAVNRATAFYPDITRRKFPTRSLMQGAAAELRVRADAVRLLAAARATGIDARLSRDAGRYICNACYYRALSETGLEGRLRLVAFVHIPWPRRRVPLGAKRSAERPTMEQIARAGTAVLSALAAQARREKTRVRSR